MSRGRDRRALDNRVGVLGDRGDTPDQEAGRVGRCGACAGQRVGGARKRFPGRSHRLSYGHLRGRRRVDVGHLELAADRTVNRPRCAGLGFGADHDRRGVADEKDGRNGCVDVLNPADDRPAGIDDDLALSQAVITAFVDDEGQFAYVRDVPDDDSDGCCLIRHSCGGGGDLRPVVVELGDRSHTVQLFLERRVLLLELFVLGAQAVDLGQCGPVGAGCVVESVEERLHRADGHVHGGLDLVGGFGAGHAHQAAADDEEGAECRPLAANGRRDRVHMATLAMP